MGREAGKIGLDLGDAHPGRVPLSWKSNESPNPADVLLLGAVAVVAFANFLPDLIQKAWSTEHDA